MQSIKVAIQEATLDLYNQKIEIELTRPEKQFGDFSTNIALQLAGILSQKPREIAEQLIERLKSHEVISEISVAGPGFINIKVIDEVLWELALQEPSLSLKDQNIVAEYSDPNPFKVLHAGHLYTSIVGDAVANLQEVAGATVHRVNYGGDVGLHVAKTLWAIIQELGGENIERLKEIEESNRSEWLTACYIKGTNAYEDDDRVKNNIIDLNKKVYQIHADNDHESILAQIYWTCRTWSYDYFDAFYKQIDTKFEKYYPESEVSQLGLCKVLEQLTKGVYEESDGAVIFNGEKYNLHTRVFINSNGIPTYEAKEVGVMLAKWRDYKFDKSIIITGNDIVEYMKVVLKSMELYEPKLVAATVHVPHGNVKLAGGVKMSSRKGNILRAADVLEVAREASRKLSENNNNNTVLAAVKYAFLKTRIGGDIIYEPEESVKLAGNSGPYLQYAHARACSILTKTKNQKPGKNVLLEANERYFLMKISEYSEVVDQAVNELMPHHVCTYLYELAQEFNKFYEKNRVVGNDREALRLAIVKLYKKVLASGLSLLGIEALEKM